MIDETLPRFLRTRDAVLGATDRSLRRRWERGELTRIRSGVYLETATWLSMDAHAKYRARVAAASHVIQIETQFAIDSAAALWRLPTVGPWPTALHILGNSSSGSSSRTDIRQHALRADPRSVGINGITVTSLARTTLDVARTSSFTRAVGMMDDAMRAPDERAFRGIHSIPPISRLELHSLLDSLMPYPSSVRARKVIDFSTGKSGSLGESISRVQFHALGIAPPELQVPFYDEDGLIGFADFYWPELDLVGEFDGEVKYRDTQYLRDQLPIDALIREKHREDRMRRVVRAFTRWGWRTATDSVRLMQHLAPFGLMRTR